MTLLSKQAAKNNGRKVDLSRHTDEDLHSLMDSVTSEMARRASVNAKRRALVRRLEDIAQSEGVTLDEVRQYLRGGDWIREQPVAEPQIEPKVEEDALTAFAKLNEMASESPMTRKASLDRQLESMFQQESTEPA